MSQSSSDAKKRSRPDTESEEYDDKGYWDRSIERHYEETGIPGDGSIDSSNYGAIVGNEVLKTKSSTMASHQLLSTDSERFLNICDAGNAVDLCTYVKQNANLLTFPVKVCLLK